MFCRYDIETVAGWFPTIDKLYREHWLTEEMLDMFEDITGGLGISSDDPVSQYWRGMCYIANIVLFPPTDENDISNPFYRKTVDKIDGPNALSGEPLIEAAGPHVIARFAVLPTAVYDGMRMSMQGGKTYSAELLEYFEQNAFNGMVGTGVRARYQDEYDRKMQSASERAKKIDVEITDEHSKIGRELVRLFCKSVEDHRETGRLNSYTIADGKAYRDLDTGGFSSN